MIDYKQSQKLSTAIIFKVMINKNFKFGKVKNDKNVKMKHTKYSALQDRKKNT